MRTLTLVFAFLCVSAFTAQTQETWSLQQCVDYALENNIQVKQQEVAVQYQESLHQQAKHNRLPNLNGQLGNNYSFGRSLSYQNTYENTNSIGVSGGLSADVTLWNGLVLQNTIKQREFDLQASTLDLQKAKDELVLSITALYLEILFAEELLAIDENQTEITKQQIARTRKMIDAGKLPRGDIYEPEAQLAREELAVTNRENNVQLVYLNLYQLLELPLGLSFKVLRPEISQLKAGAIQNDAGHIFANALQTRPEIQASQLRIESAQSQLEQAKGSRLPSISLGGSYYNNYNDNYTQLVESSGSYRTIPLGSQLRNNQRYGFGLNVNIPIFNKFQVRTSIQNAELQIQDYEYRLASARNTLQKDVEQAYSNAIAALKRYISSEKAVLASEEAFRYAEEKFNVGTITSVEYNQIKNNLVTTQSQWVQAKYNYIFCTKIIDFYNGVPITL
ncbi:MAG: TolC family protein [Prolixibacteraceae bacterium]|nr:TolC family protein [Prolixibacteraceae bacterium]